MHNISKFILTFFIAIPLVFAFGSQTVKQIDEIKNNTGTDIVLNPTDKVKINYFAGEKALQSTVDGELEESAVTNTELGFVSGVTSSIQTQIDSKTPLTRLINTTAPLQGGGDLTTDRTLSILQSGAAQDGYLSSTDWNTFNNKQSAITGTDGDLYYWNSGLSNLAIGTTNQILQVSALGFPEWADLPPSVSVTTKGDIQTYSTAPDRLPVGSDNQILSANSATATGLEWIDPPNTSPTTTQGDIIIRGATEDERLPIGTVDQILVSNGTTLAYQDLPVSLPDQTGHNGEYLRSNGTDADWQNVNDSVNDVKDNLLECASFEDCTFEGVITTSGTSDSAISARSSEVSAYNDSKLNLSATAASTLDYTYTKTASFDGKQMVAYCEIKTANTQVTFSAGADGVEAGSLSVSSGDTWKYYKIPFVGGATSQYFKVDHSNGAETPNIDIDNCFIGKTQDATFKIDTTITDWQEFTLALDATTTAPTKGTHQEFAKWRRVGDSMEIQYSLFQTTAGTAGSGIYLFRLPSGYTMDTSKLINLNGLGLDVLGSAEVYLGTLFEGAVKARPIDNALEISVLSDTVAGNSLGSSFGSLANATARYSFTAKVPIAGWSSEKSTVVTQDTELTAKTANTFVAGLGSTGSVGQENFDWINGSCANPSTGNITCTFNTGIFTEPPVCVVALNNTGTNFNKSASINDVTSTGFKVSTWVDSTATPSSQFTQIRCSKTGADVNKSATIVGKFENINSSDLCQVEANGNDGETITGSTEDVPFKNKIKDNCNIFNNTGNTGSNTNDAVIPTRSGFYLISGGFFGQNIVQGLDVYENGSTVIKRCGVNPGGASTYIFSCLVNLISGNTYTLRTTATQILTNSTSLHTLQITELPDYEAIVKNLSDQKVECQTKTLSGNVTSNNAIPDLQFDNLTIGKRYEVCINMRARCPVSTDNIDLTVKDNSVGIAVTTAACSIVSSGLVQKRYSCSKFNASTTTITTESSSITSGNEITGTGNYTGTWVELCELPDTYVETTKF